MRLFEKFQSPEKRAATVLERADGLVAHGRFDDAIEALGHLQASGRMVGAITHVEAMKAQVPTGIEVRRRPAGGGP